MLSIMPIIVPYKCEITDIIGNKSMYFDQTGFVLSILMVSWNYIQKLVLTLKIQIQKLVVNISSHFIIGWAVDPNLNYIYLPSYSGK